jgi:DedD protein
VIAFPLVFESQPRPIPVDLPIEIPRKDAVDPLPAPPRAAKPAAVTAVAPAAGAVVEPAAAAPSAASTSTSAPKADAASAPGVVASVPAAGRYVVQVGAFADATATREARLKVERLGLKTYTQVVDTDNGKRTRVRIGPFESRDEASRALATLKAANLPGAVLAL